MWYSWFSKLGQILEIKNVTCKFHEIFSLIFDVIKKHGGELIRLFMKYSKIRDNLVFGESDRVS